MAYRKKSDTPPAPSLSLNGQIIVTGIETVTRQQAEALAQKQANDPNDLIGKFMAWTLENDLNLFKAFAVAEYEARERGERP